MLGHRGLVATQYVLLSTLVGPVLISFGPALFLYVVHKYIVSYYVDLHEPKDRRHAHQLEKRYTFTFLHYILAFGYVVCMLYLLVMCGANPLSNPLMNNNSPSVLHDLAFPLYSYMQLALYLFSVFVRGFSITRIVTRGLQSFHILAAYLLNVAWRVGRIPFPPGLLIMLFYFDWAIAFVEFERAAEGEGAKFISWPAVRSLWLVLRLALPAYALYRGSLGYGITFFIICTVLVVQLFLVLVLPNKRRRGRPWKED